MIDVTPGKLDPETLPLGHSGFVLILTGKDDEIRRITDAVWNEMKRIALDKRPEPVHRDIGGFDCRWIPETEISLSGTFTYTAPL